ncbi:MAG: hypothetical protein ABSE69_18095 [Roseiarcus sp.]
MIADDDIEDNKMSGVRSTSIKHRIRIAHADALSGAPIIRGDGPGATIAFGLRLLLVNVASCRCRGTSLATLKLKVP